MLKSTGLRLSIFVAGLILVSLLFSGVAASFSARSSAMHVIRDQLNLEVAAIGSELALEGLDATVLAINARTDQHGAFEYRLTDEQGRWLAGGLPPSAYIAGFHEMKFPSDSSSTQAEVNYFVLTQELDGGIKVTVAEEYEKAFVVHSAIMDGLILAGGIASVFCLSIGLWMTRRLLRRLDNLSALVGQVSNGNLEARYSHLGDLGATDIDDIGLSLDGMLERINVLLGGLRRITRDIAHDLRTPLSLLKQKLEEAAAADTLEHAVERVEQANTKVDEVLRIFDAILRLGEIEAGSSRERFSVLSLSKVVEDVALAYLPAIEEIGGQLECDISPSMEITGDRQLVAQAIANLVENAMRHGGSKPKITVSVYASSGGVIVEVTDSGPGVPREMWSNIIKPFTRLDPSRSKSGTGLGLAIVSAIASLHDGKLEFDTTDQQFKVRINFLNPDKR